MRLIYISVIVLFCFFSSCKNDSKFSEFNIEELQKREYDSVRQLLSLSRSFYEKNDYENAILNLENLINNYATYKEVLEAQELLKNARVNLIFLKITEATSIKAVLILLDNNVDAEITIAASEKVNELIKNTDDIGQLEDYINQNTLKEHSALAANKITELKEKKKHEAYASAVQNESSHQWKKFLEDYPNYSKRSEIEKTIIMLEVSEIFSGEYGEIPASQLLGERNNRQSSIDIKNETKYTLTLRYSGGDVKKISIQPYGMETLKIKSGEYRVTASVDAANVRNFAGRESLYGDYKSSYFISNN